MRVEVEGKKREKTKLTLPFLFLPFNLSSSSFSSSSSSSNTMLGSAPQLQDAPGVAYLCGDCGECEKNREELTGDRRFFFFFSAVAVVAVHRCIIVFCSLWAPWLFLFICIDRA